MNDDIELPPLPQDVIPGMRDWIDDVRRAAVRYDRERRAKLQAKPVVHEAHLSLSSVGSWRESKIVENECVRLTLRWTDDGRAWIDSEQNRELARRLRVISARTDIPVSSEVSMREAADALDGGER